MSRERGFTRLFAKLDDTLASEKYYEAHQIYRTLHFRLSSSKKYEELLKLMEEGAIKMLEKNQMESGADLSSLFIDSLVKSGIPITEEYMEKAANLFEMMKPGMPERDAYLYAATKWATHPNEKRADPFFHGKVAKVYWKEKNYTSARQHFLHSADSMGFACMLIELHKSKGYNGEFDLFIAQAVLQVLCLRKYELASETFTYYTKEHPEILDKTGGPYKSKLLDAVCCLLTAVKRKDLQLFQNTLDAFRHTYDRDPTFSGMLAKIGNYYFDIKPATKQRNTGLLENFVQSIFNNLDQSEASESEDDITSTSTVVPTPNPRPSPAAQNARTIKDSMQDLE